MRIGVFCSGGDAPGMNACVRAVVRTAVGAGHEVIGIRHGYEGILSEDFFINQNGEPLMTLRSVSDLSRMGGTILHSRRSDAFRTVEGQKLAAANLRKNNIDALIPIGGDGTLHGAVDLAKHWNGQIIGCPGTIDNDLMGTDFTIGFATAVNTAVEALDKLRDTAQSHERMFLVEVMGRHSGYIGIFTALAGGAEVVCIPETTTNIKEIVEHLKVLKSRGKQSIMMVVSEGDELGNAHVLNEDLIEAGCPFQTRVLTLGHLQRGGTPAPADRILATELGDLAVRAIIDGHTGKMAGRVYRDLVLTEFAETYAEHKPVPEELVSLLATMAQ